jgi:hypothetical protein
LFYLSESDLNLSTRLRQAGLVLGVWVVVTGLLAVAFNLATGGEFFLHTVIYKRQPWEWSRWLYYARMSIQSYGVLWIAAVYAAWQVRQLPVVRAWLWYFAISSAGMFFMIGLLGAATNYFLEPILIATALFGFGLASVLAQPNLRLLLFAALLLELLQLRHVPVWRDYAFTPTEETRQLGDLVVARVASETGLILADDVGWVVAGGGKPVMDDPVLLTDLNRQSVWDDGPVIRLLKDGEVGLVLTLYDPAQGDCLYTPGMCQAILSHYCISESIGTLQVYRPKVRGCSDAPATEAATRHGLTQK